MDWLGFFLPRFSTRKPQLESLSPPSEADLARLDELREMGSRLELPHPVRAFLAFPTEAGARGAREQLQKEGFNCQLCSGADGSWVLTAVMLLVPRPGAITRLREQLEEVASTMDGTYRGWDAPLVY